MRFIASLLLCLTLATSSFGQVQVAPPTSSEGLSFPSVLQYEAGKLVFIVSKEPATWAVLSPTNYKDAYVKDEKTLAVVTRDKPIYILADYGKNSQLVIIAPTKAPDPDPEPGPGPGPGPGPTPPPPPNPVPNDYGIGKASYEAASVLPVAGDRKVEAQAIAQAFRDSVGSLRSDKDSIKNELARIGGVAKLKTGLNFPLWEGWFKVVNGLMKSQTDAKKIGSLNDWRNVFSEIAASLEAVR